MRRLLIAISLSLLLSACRGPLGIGGGGPGGGLGRFAGPTPTLADLLARRLLPLSPTPTARPTSTRTPTPEPAGAQPASAGSPELAGLLLASPTPAPASEPVFRVCSPLLGILREDLPRLVSDGYHPPPRLRPDDRHHGVDFAYYHWKGGGPIAGTGIQSVLAGRVAMALEDTFPYGNVVIVETAFADLPDDLVESFDITSGQSLYLLYAHMQEQSLKVKLGDRVAACQQIGAVGRTGNTLAYHLHLETRLGLPGATFTGMSAFTETASDDEKRNYRTWRISGKYQHFDPMKLLLYGYENLLKQPVLTPPSVDED